MYDRAFSTSQYKWQQYKSEISSLRLIEMKTFHMKSNGDFASSIKRHHRRSSFECNEEKFRQNESTVKKNSLVFVYQNHMTDEGHKIYFATVTENSIQTPFKTQTFRILSEVSRRE
ncbi:CLUMA_CG021567, isoform A [Clunio marinus]|uniref:CLUMA_CG021567, isoform A n=1 Tax=Clunio marinus TaxID=568069 RepID=A0A1J1JA45_9DIPT|nr:CLUMA_CG021567, isoform A [Clunio marinus]